MQIGWTRNGCGRMANNRIFSIKPGKKKGAEALNRKENRMGKQRDPAFFIGHSEKRAATVKISNAQRENTASSDS